MIWAVISAVGGRSDPEDSEDENHMMKLKYCDAPATLKVTRETHGKKTRAKVFPYECVSGDSRWHASFQSRAPQSEPHLTRLTSPPSAAASLPAFTATPEFMVPKLPELMAFPRRVFQRETADARGWRETRPFSGSSRFCNPHAPLAAHPRFREYNPAVFPTQSQR